MIVYIEDNFFGNFINIIKRMIYTPEEKIFMYNKYLVLRSTTLVQRAWRTKYKSKTAPNRSTISSVVFIYLFIYIFKSYNKRQSLYTFVIL